MRRDFSSVHLHKIDFRHQVVKLAMVLLAVMLVAGPLFRPASVHAQLNQCSIPRGHDHIVQDCPRFDRYSTIADGQEVSLYLQQLEAQAIDEILVRHGLSGEQDRQRLLTWERGLIRAALFDKVLGIIKKPIAQRSSIENKVVNALARMVQQPRIDSAEAALDYYNAWAANPCKMITSRRVAR